MKIKCTLCGYRKEPKWFRWENKTLNKKEKVCIKCKSRDAAREREYLENKPFNDLIKMRW